MGPRPAEPTTSNGGGGGDGREDNLKENWIRALYWTNYTRGCNPEVDLWFARVVEKLRVDPFLDSCELEIDQSPLGQFLVGARMNSLDLAILMGDLWMVLMILRKSSIRDNIIRGPIQDLSKNRKFLRYTPIYDADTRTGIFFTPLHLAVEGENSLIVAALLEKGADVNAQNWQGDTPLDLVCKKENFRMLDQLLANDTRERKSPLHVAVRLGDVDLVRKLPFVKNVNAFDHQQMTPLHLAIEGGHSDIVGVLLEKGVDVNAQNWQGDTPLHLACKKENFSMLEQLLARDSKEKKSPFHVAVRLGDVDLVRKLPFGNVNAVDHQQTTPLHLAVEGGHSDIVGVLLEKGADADVPNGLHQTPLLLAGRKRNVKMLEQLLEKDYKEEKKPIHVAVLLGDVELMEKLSSPNVNAIDLHGKTPLHYLATRPFTSNGVLTSILQFLAQDKKLDMKALDSKGVSAFYVAVIGCKTQFVIALLDSFNAQIHLNETCNKDRGPPIQIAVEGGDKFKDIERALMECEPVKSYMAKLYRDRQVYVDAANAILVGAALIASVTFASWLQLPLNYTSYFGEGYSSSIPAPSTSDVNYVNVEYNIPLRAFWIFNALSFYFAIATVV